MDVTPGYFEAMGISMVRGRTFDERDNETAPRVVIVDERLAKHFWPNSDPIGRRMFQPSDSKDLLKVDEHTVWLTVVGVARTLRYEHLDDSGATVGAYYFPIAQEPDSILTFALKTTGDSDSAVRALRAEILRLDPDLAVFDVHSMSERIDLSLAESRCFWRRSEFMACWRTWWRNALVKLGFEWRWAARERVFSGLFSGKDSNSF
jgi:hypothetical protein